MFVIACISTAIVIVKSATTGRNSRVSNQASESAAMTGEAASSQVLGRVKASQAPTSPGCCELSADMALLS